MSSGRRTNDVHVLLFVTLLIYIALMVWASTWRSSVPADLGPVRRTPQECADNYRAMPENIKAQWSSSEEYINECTQ